MNEPIEPEVLHGPWTGRRHDYRVTRRAGEPTLELSYPGEEDPRQWIPQVLVPEPLLEELLRVVAERDRLKARLGASFPTVPFFVWLAELPEEGSVVIEALNEADARERADFLLGDEREEDDPPASEALIAKAVTATDVIDLQEAAEKAKWLEAERDRLRALSGMQHKMLYRLVRERGHVGNCKSIFLESDPPEGWASRCTCGLNDAATLLLNPDGQQAAAELEELHRRETVGREQIKEELREHIGTLNRLMAAEARQHAMVEKVRTLEGQFDPDGHQLRATTARWIARALESMLGEPAPADDTCTWPGCSSPALCQSGNFGNQLVCGEHFLITNGPFLSREDAERLLQKAHKGMAYEGYPGRGDWHLDDSDAAFLSRARAALLPEGEPHRRHGEPKEVPASPPGDPLKGAVENWRREMANNRGDFREEEPDQSPPASGFREVCLACNVPSPLGFQVPDSIWAVSIPERLQEKSLCICCFARFADEAGVEWDREIQFFPVSLRTHLGAALAAPLRDGEEARDPHDEIKAAGIPDPELYNPVSQVYFRAGLLACREYMARFVEAESPTIAKSIRANWWPHLGQDFGAPRKLRFDELTDGEYGAPDFRCKAATEISPTLEALPIALGFLEMIAAGLPIPPAGAGEGSKP
jgi:hypothetical protein